MQCMKNICIVVITALAFFTIPVSSVYALTGPFTPGGQYNPINITVQEDYTQQGQDAQQQFIQTEQLLNMQAISEPAACASILSQARSFIQTAITQHSDDPGQTIADATYLNYYYNQNALCIAQQRAQQCPSGYDMYQGSCITFDQSCKVQYGPLGEFSGYNANGSPECGCSEGSSTLYSPITDVKCTMSPFHAAPTSTVSNSLNCPLNSTSNGSSCVCNTGYTPQGTLNVYQCVLTAQNSSTAAASTAATPSLFVSNLSLGSTGYKVYALQTLLAKLGFFQGDATSYYGPKTKAAVMQFQAAKGINQTGTVGPKTRAALNAL
jgi:hypothetical protein